MADYKHEVVNQDVRYLRNECPPTVASVSGTGFGMVCRCGCEPTPPVTPKTPAKIGCVTRIVVNNLRRYRAMTPGTHIRVCS